MNDIKEEWKDIQGYEGLYKISNHGRILGLTSNKILKPNDVVSRGVKANRLKNTLCKNGKLKNFTIHNLVYKHFVGEIKGIIDFKDGDYTNCCVDNLIDVQYTHIQRVNKNIRVLDKSTGKLYSSIKEFAKSIGKTDMGARWILKSGLKKYSQYKVIGNTLTQDGGQEG